jgi:hypothetical protein
VGQVKDFYFDENGKALPDDEIEVLGFYRTAKQGKEADLEISIKNGSLAKIFITNKRLYNKEGQLKEIEQ